MCIYVNYGSTITVFTAVIIYEANQGSPRGIAVWRHYDNCLYFPSPFFFLYFLFSKLLRNINTAQLLFHFLLRRRIVVQGNTKPFFFLQATHFLFSRSLVQSSFTRKFASICFSLSLISLVRTFLTIRDVAFWVLCVFECVCMGMYIC